MRFSRYASRLCAAALFATSLPATAAVLINELDADQAGTDAAEFVELYNTSATPVSLDGMVLVFFNGSATNDVSYAAFDLDGFTIAANDFFVVGASTVTGVDLDFAGATDQLQNGQDAVALYTGNASDFPTGTPATATSLVDAVVYDTADPDDAALIAILTPGQPQIDENGGNNGTGHSIQRSSDGAGGARNTSSFITAAPTPGASNGTPPPPPPTATPVAISMIQGAQHRSPLEGMTVVTRGIVSSIFELSSTNRGFYLQNPDGDGNPATSEGILVFVGGATMPVIAVGNEVTVQGVVTEFRPGGASTANLTTTELTSPMTTVETTSIFTNTLAATVIGAAGRMPPTEVVDNDTTGGNVEAPANTTFDPANDGVDFYESLEGMLVRIDNGVVVGPTNGFGEVFLLPDGGVGATGVNARGGITLNELPGGAVDYNPERIQVDDDFFRVAFGDMPAANVGDSASSVEGVVTYNFGNFEVLPTLRPTFTDGGIVREVSQVATGPDRLTIANYNVENLDINDLDGDTDVADGRFDAVADQVVNNLDSPDIIALQEVQDDSGSANDGVVVGTQTLGMLVARIAAAGGPTYTAFEIAPVNNAEGGQPGGNIRVAYLYNAARVDLVEGTVGAGGTLDATSPVIDAGGLLNLSFNPGRIDPPSPAWASTRVSLAAVFEFNGQRILTINNHWSSKGGSTPILGRTQPFINGNEDSRSAQATVVKAFVDAALGVQADAKIAVLGDLNEFTFEEPLLIVTGELAGDVVLRDLADELIANPLERYSYVFEGNTQSLDHILVSDALLEPAVATQFDAVHINSEFSDQLSDHDPDIASFLLPAGEAGCTTPGTLQLRRVQQTVLEGAGNAQINVSRVGGSCGAATVSYSTTAGSAVAGLDYTSVSGQLSWADGDTLDRVFLVPVINDELNEPLETFSVSVASATGASLGDASTGSLRIRDDDAPPQLSISADQTVVEGAQDVLTTFSLSSPSNRDVLVRFAISGTAQLLFDYRFNGSQVVRIPAGQMSVSRALHSTNQDIVDDRRPEPSETIILTITSVSAGAVLGSPASITITIQDND